MTLWTCLQRGYAAARADNVRLAVATLLLHLILILLACLAGHTYDTWLRGGTLLPHSVAIISGLLALWATAHAQMTSLLRLNAQLEATCQAAVWEQWLRLTPPPPEHLRWWVIRISGVPFVQVARWGLPLIMYLGVFTGLNWQAVWLLTALMLLAAGLGLRYLLTHAASLPPLENAHHQFTRHIVRGIAKIRVAQAETPILAQWQNRQTAYQHAQHFNQRLISHINLIYTLYPGLVAALFFIMPPKVNDGMAVTTLLVGGLWLWTGQALFNTILGLAPVLMAYRILAPFFAAVPSESPARHPASDFKGAVTLDAVTFRQLQAVSLAVAPGEWVAIIGAAGVGKTTLLQLLLGLETPTHGRILYDTVPLEQFDLRALRQQIGVVLPTSRLHAGSLLSNIVGMRSLPLAAAWEAARLAELDTLINSLAMGMHTLLDAGGDVLSQGQRQRLLIARALAGKPRLLILDNATSALDDATEAALFQNLAALNITLIIVTHRRSTLAYADKVLVLADGHLNQVSGFQLEDDIASLNATLPMRADEAGTAPPS